MKYLKKIKIDRVEAFLGIKLKPNTISIGADTASYHTAFAIIRTSDKYLTLESLEKIEVPKLSKKSTTKQVLNNVDLFTEQLDNLKNKWSTQFKFNQAKIEDCFYQFSIKTTKLLAYNGILTYDRLKRISENATLIQANSARTKIKFKKSSKKIKGQELKKEIVAFINNALDLKLKKTTDQDIADGCVLALAGLKKD